MGHCASKVLDVVSPVQQSFLLPPQRPIQIISHLNRLYPTTRRSINWRNFRPSRVVIIGVPVANYAFRSAIFRSQKRHLNDAINHWVVMYFDAMVQNMGPRGYSLPHPNGKDTSESENMLVFHNSVRGWWERKKEGEREKTGKIKKSKKVD